MKEESLWQICSIPIMWPSLAVFVSKATRFDNPRALARAILGALGERPESARSLAAPLSIVTAKDGSRYTDPYLARYFVPRHFRGKPNVQPAR